MLSLGVLALQGGFREHVAHLHKLSDVGYPLQVREVRSPAHLSGVSGLILPGGESTAIYHLLQQSGLAQAIIEGVRAKTLYVWGTCAGAILLAKQVEGLPASLALLDVSIRRNAFGRQSESFIGSLHTHPFGSEAVAPTVFIRAPVITQTAGGARCIATLETGECVAALHAPYGFVTAFHPELTPDTRWHRYFADQVMAHEAS